MIRFFFIVFIQTILLFTPQLKAEADTPTPQGVESPQKNSKTSTPYFNVEDEGPEFGESTFWGEMINMLITLGMIIGILVGLTWVMRKMQTSRVKFANESSLIKVIDHRPLSTKSAVYLLQINNRAIAIADSQNGVSLLAEFPLEENEKNDNKNDFRDYLERQK